MHKHLTWTDRLKIEKGLKEGLKPLAIAARLHVHNTTIYREIKRGTYTHLNSDLTTEERYSPEIAEQRYRDNLAAKGGSLKIGNDRELAEFIERKIVEEGYSPAAVVGEIKKSGLSFRTEICEKTIYNYIDKGVFLRLTRKDLPERGKRKRKYDKVERKKAARAPKGESIEERPKEINERATFGHWEGDCVCGKKRTKEALFVLSERLTRQEIIIKMPDQTAASVVRAPALAPVPHVLEQADYYFIRGFAHAHVAHELKAFAAPVRQRAVALILRAESNVQQLPRRYRQAVYFNLPRERIPAEKAAFICAAYGERGLPAFGRAAVLHKRCVNAALYAALLRQGKVHKRQNQRRGQYDE